MVMKRFLVSAWLSISILINMSGCGGGNTVELPQNPDPMPTGPPSVAGQPAPAGEQAKQAASE
jgi:hypothetical protein